MCTRYTFLRNNIIILILTFFYAIPAWGNEYTEDGIIYSIEGNAATIIRYTGDENILEIPATISGKNVTSIAAEAFKNCSGLETITLPEHLVSVGKDAFKGSGINHIILNCQTIGKTDVGDKWFESIKSQIHTVVLNNSVNIIGDAVFSGFINVENINIPEGVTTIKNLAFEGWKKLASITIPSTITSISPTAFLSCSNLRYLTVNGGTTYHDGSINAIIDAENKVILGCTGTTSTLQTVPAITAIGDDAFREVGITNITIPTSVTSIGKRAFNNTEITTITIPAAVTSIGDGAFNSCKNLAQIIVADGNDYYDSRNNCNAIIEKATNKLLFGCGETTIPITVTDIAQNAFYGVSKENFTVTLPEGMTSLGKGAFNGCTGLTSITFPPSFTTIGEEAFKGCNGLRDFTIPTTVTTINQHAFQECNGLESVTIPSNVITLGDEVWYNCANIKIVKIKGGNKVDSKLYLPVRSFKNCSKLEEVYFPNKANFYIKKEAFIGCKNIKKVYCQHSASPYYPNIESESIFDNELNLNNVTLYAFESPSTHGEPWTSFKTPFIHFDWFDKKIGESEDEIYYNIINTGDEVYAIVASDQRNDIHPDKDENLYNRENITIPSTISVSGFDSPIPVKVIDRDAFKNKTTILTISFSQNIKRIDASAFEGCTNIAEALIGCTNLEEIGSYAFKGCTNLTTVTLPNSTTTKIGDEAFKNCVALTTINIPSTLTTLGKGAFYGCKITSAPLPAGITIINDDTFRDCGLLETVTFNGDVTIIGKNAFYNCLNLKNLVLPSSLQTIGSEAFRSCLLLITLDIPSNTNSIEEGAFRSCTGLTNVKFPNGLTAIEGYTFYGCSNITSLAFPEQLTTIHQHAFNGCSGITSLVLPQHLTTINQNAFSNCTNLEAISIQNEIESIGAQAFSGCTKIDNIYCFKQTPPEINSNSFEFTTLTTKESPTKLYVPSEGEGNYESDALWGLFGVGKIIAMQQYDLKYVVDGVVPIEIGERFIKVWAGTPIIPIDKPTKGEREFYGWIGLPEIMPAENVKVTGNFKYQITYTITDNLESEFRFLTEDNPKVEVQDYFYGATVTPPTSGHNGYTIVWETTVPETMPSEDLSINSQIARKPFTLTFRKYDIDNISFTDVVENVLYKAPIDANSHKPTDIPDYVFEWEDNYPLTMPAEDKVIEGHYVPQPVRGNIIYRFNNDGSARIVGYEDANTTSLTIPTTIDFNGSHDVKSIEHHAFNGYTKLESVTFTSPSNLTSIGLQAFRDCKALTKIEIPTSVSDIDKEAFMNCTALQSVTIEKGESPQLSSLKTRTFSGCTSLESITFPNTSSFQIEEYAFEGCNNIKKVYCLNSNYPSIIEVVDYAIHNTTDPFNINPLMKPTLYGDTDPSAVPWTNFTFINRNNVNKKVETLYYNIIGSGTEAYAIVTNDQPDDITATKDEYNSTNITIPATIDVDGIGTNIPVKGVERKAFYNKTNITSITFNNNIDCIEESAFEGCTGISNLQLGNTKLKVIGPSAFKGCTGLTNVTLPTTYSIPLQICDEAFMNCGVLAGINIPNQIDLIGESAFEGCLSLTSDINTTVNNNIGSKAFKGCNKLESVVISGNITNIGSYAFYGCTKLSSITIPNTITEIEASAFYDCKALKVIILPDALTTIENSAFQNCTGLTSIILPDNLTTIGSSAFKGYTLKNIYSKRLTAPTASTNSFDDNVYNNTNVTLHIKANATGYDSAPWNQIQQGILTQYKLVYMLNGELYNSKLTDGGTPITKEANPTSDPTRTFSGWIGEPEIMPAHDVTVRGNYSYHLIYKFDNETKVDCYKYCEDVITSLKPSIPRMTGYSVKWSEDLDIMPARDVTITGNYVIKKYKLTYVIDGDVYSQENKDYNDVITLPNMPQYEDHFFTWGNYPSRMPDNDLTIFGNYTAQKTINGVTIRVNKSSGTAEVFPNTDNINVTAVSIPETMTIKDLDGNYVSFPITSISKDAFSGYRKLTSISIPKTVNHIGVQAFRDCQLLTELVLPNEIENIDKDAFLYCYGLVKIVCSASTMPNTHYEAFRNTNVTSKTTLYVPQSLLGSYKTTTPWSSFYKIESISSSDPSDTNNSNNPSDTNNSNNPSDTNNSNNPSDTNNNTNNPSDPNNPNNSSNSNEPSNSTGINGIMIDGVEVEAFYTLEGRRIIKPQHGINIVRLKDGRIVKHYFK